MVYAFHTKSKSGLHIKIETTRYTAVAESGCA